MNRLQEIKKRQDEISVLTTDDDACIFYQNIDTINWNRYSPERGFTNCYVHAAIRIISDNPQPAVIQLYGHKYYQCERYPWHTNDYYFDDEKTYLKNKYKLTLKNRL